MDIEAWMVVVVAGVLVAIVAAIFYVRGPAIPEALKVGNPMPDIDLADEDGNPVRPSDLRGQAAAFLFIRGRWCPFCSKQVQQLTASYRRINELGAKLVFVTQKPLDTTRRVAEFFEVEFDFWLDDALQAAEQIGIRLPKGVPRKALEDYGPDTVWPTAVIVDAGGTIRYSRLSKYIFDRPDPERLVAELEKVAKSG